jgi:hypothetical protein
VLFCLVVSLTMNTTGPKDGALEWTMDSTKPINSSCCFLSWKMSKTQNRHTVQVGNIFNGHYLLFSPSKDLEES